MIQSETREYAVHGITCAHCVLSVREEVAAAGSASGPIRHAVEER